MNFYCNKNSASILCFVINNRENCIESTNQVHDIFHILAKKRVALQRNCWFSMGPPIKDGLEKYSVERTYTANKLVLLVPYND